jgi:serine/threonine-protein kinase
MSLNIGDVIDDKYRILRLVGEGGMGAVYEGENRLISRRVAIKVLYGVASMSQDAIQRFEREAQAAGRIGNDHILEIIDLGRLPDGSRYMVMEYLDGETLGARIKRIGKMSPTDLVPVFKQVLTGLQAAHDAGIVHRDLKPDNIFILAQKAGHKDFVKIIDFGISKFQDPSDHNMTRTGTVMGTPFYMSPEQAKGVGVDRRSDLYAVGAMLYEAVSGSVPFDGKTFNELMFKIVLSDPRPLSEMVPDLNPGFASVVLKGMARDAQHRFQTAREFAAALERWSSTGAAVTLPPEAGNLIAEFGATQLPSGQVPSPAHTPLQGSPGALAAAGPMGVGGGGTTPGLGAASPGGVTHGSWANSQTAQPNAGSRKWLPLAVAGGGAALIAVIAMIAMSGKDKPDDGSAVPATGPAAAAEHKPAAEPAKVEKPAEPPAAASANPVVRPITDTPSAAPIPAAAPAPSAVVSKKPATTSTAAPTPKPALPKKPKKVDLGY